MLKKTIFFTLILAIFFNFFAFAQSNIKVKVEMVNVLCVAMNRNGKYITNLKKDDFEIYENGVKQKIERFSSRTDLPLLIALLIDTSASVVDKLKFEKDAAVDFFNSVLSPKDLALVAAFDSSVTLIQDFTNDVNEIKEQLKLLKAGGGTALFDAIYLICQEKMRWSSQDKRKIIVIISDGDDTVSSTTYEDALKAAQESGVVIYAISTNRAGYFGHAGKKEGDTILKDFAKETGGKLFTPSLLSDLYKSFEEINKELRNQYSISYIPTNKKHDGTFRKITIKVKKRGIKLRYRKGYYAPKE